MVSSNIRPGAIVEAQWLLPQGGFKVHPALIISVRDVADEDEVFVAVMLSSKTNATPTTFEIKPEMVSKPSRKHPVVYAKCHLISSFDATARYEHHGFMYPAPFQQLIAHFQQTVLGLPG